MQAGLSGGSVAALVIVVLLLLVATGFAGWYKGWIKVPAWLSSNRNMHTKFDPAVADMFLNPLATPTTAATTTLEVAGATTTASGADGYGAGNMLSI